MMVGMSSAVMIALASSGGGGPSDPTPEPKPTPRPLETISYEERVQVLKRSETCFQVVLEAYRTKVVAHGGGSEFLGSRLFAECTTKEAADAAADLVKQARAWKPK